MVDSTTTFLLDLGLFAVFGLLFSLVFARLKLPVVTGQIIAGMIVGPYVLGWVRDPVTINDLSAIGIVLLLFIIGLELDPVDLRRMAGKVAAIAVIETSVAFLLGFAGAAVFLHTTVLQAVVFGMVASITSTAIVGRLFIGRSALNSPETSTLIGLMIMEDMVAVVFLISLASLISDGTLLDVSSFARISVTVAGGVALVVGGYLVATYVAPRIIDYLSAFEEEFEEIPFLFALGLGFLFAVLAAILGYSPGTGAFIIGLSIRGKRSKFLESRLTTIKDLFIVLFFISMGSLINPLPALAIGLPLAGVVLLFVVGKFAAGYSSSRSVLGMKGKGAYLFGSWLVPRGEFSFVIGQLALSLGIISVTYFSALGLIVLATAVIGPVLQRAAEPRVAPSLYPSKPQVDGRH